MTNISGRLIPAKNTPENAESSTTKTGPRTESPLFVGSVEKAFSVLQAFNQSRKSLSLKDISEITGMGKSAAQRFCFTLVELGFLERDASSRRMQPAVRLLELSHTYLASNPISSIAAPYLLQARENSGEAVNLGIPMDQDVIYIARLASTNSHIVHPIVGGRAPMFCTSSGRAYLSTLPEAEVSALLDASDLSPITRNTITERKEILRRIDDVSNKGYATANQECIVGELTIAAPILGPNRQGVGSVNICVTRPAWTMEQLEEELAPIVCQTAHNITLALSN